MKIKNLTLKIFTATTLFFVVIIAAVLRLLPHPANVAPIAAVALFGGANIKNKKIAIALPLFAMFFSDIFLGFSQSTPFVYFCFFITGVIGIWLSKRKTINTVVAASVLSSIIFFLVTNFGYWLTQSLYPKTLAGQLESYWFALPFFRNTLLGDLFYTGVFFGVYEVVKKIIVSFQDDKNLHQNRG